MWNCSGECATATEREKDVINLSRSSSIFNLHYDDEIMQNRSIQSAKLSDLALKCDTFFSTLIDENQE